ncbi:MAG: SLC13 family permease [Anaerolineales bacterium]|jgi:di/tricarboxylate transporter
MTSTILLLLLIISSVSILMIATRLRPDLLALLTLVALGLTRLVTPEEDLAGFSGTAVITILAIFIISEGLRQTGVTMVLGRFMMRLSGGGEVQSILVTMLTAATLSLFMNNIAAAGVLLPAVISLSRQSRVSPSRLLMPMAFGTVLGGMATLLTTANIIVSGSLRERGLAPFGLLDFLPVGVPVVLAGTAYMVLAGRRLLPERYPPGQEARAVRLRAELESLYGIKTSLCELKVNPGSGMAGLSLQEGRWASRLGLHVVGLARQGRLQVAPSPEVTVHEGDVVLAQGQPSVELLNQNGLQLLTEPAIPMAVTNEETVLGEVVLSPHAGIFGKSLSQLRFRERFGLNVLALWRQGSPIRSNLSELPLRAGDTLLVQGTASKLSLLREGRDFILLAEDPDAVMRPGKAYLAAGIGLVTLGIAALGWMPVAVTTLAGASLMLVTGCLTMDEGYRAVDWKSMFLIAGMWPLGTAISTTGLATLVANRLVSFASGSGPLVIAGLMLLGATILNQIIAGQAAVPIMLAPIGLAIAQASGVDPRGMAMAVALGCSLAFPTPLGHPVNTLVMGSGGYSYRDYLRVGGPLTLLTAGVVLIGLHLFWHL